MRIIRNADQKWTPWKNGGGETIEIACGPDHASLETFDWRISRARVDRSGPFSLFPAIDRTIAILEGNRIALHVENSEAVILSPDTPPFSFAGDVHVRSEVLNGAITDLNVMTKRGSFCHRLTAVGKGRPVAASTKTNAIVAIFSTGPANIKGDRGGDCLLDGDAVFLSPQDGILNAVPEYRASLFLIEIWSAPEI